MAQTETHSEAGGGKAEWLIVKRGYFYRPNRQGYTSSVQEAGRYTYAEAKAEVDNEPASISMQLVTEAKDVQDIPAAIRDRLAQLERQRDDLLSACVAMKAEIDSLRWGQPFPGRPHAVMDTAEAAIARATGAA